MGHSSIFWDYGMFIWKDLILKFVHGIFQFSRLKVRFLLSKNARREQSESKMKLKIRNRKSRSESNSESENLVFLPSVFF